MTSEQRPGSPWHAGERLLQHSAGVAQRMEELGNRVIRDHLLEQHQTFYPQLPFVVLGVIDAKGDVWATLRDGKPGFMQPVDAHHLHLRLPREPHDPADSGMDHNQAIGLLGIDLLARRRNRLNGNVQRSNNETGFEIAVEHSFGNCPRYIQQRHFSFSHDSDLKVVQEMQQLDTAARALIRGADSFFVASCIKDMATASGSQVDVSHRGGKPGFVRVDEDGTLTIPDFAGNLFFNTLGNFVVNPQGGLVFVDFANGDLLQMTGDVRIILDSPEIAAFEGAERLWRFSPRRIIRRSNALALRWSPKPDGSSPYSLMTGSWERAGVRPGLTDTAP